MKINELEFSEHYSDLLKSHNKDVCPCCGGKLNVFCIDYFAIGGYCEPTFAVICDDCMAAANTHWRSDGYDYHNDERCLDAVSELKENILTWEEN